jgi:hypothetical protein
MVLPGGPNKQRVYRAGPNVKRVYQASVHSDASPLHRPKLSSTPTPPRLPVPAQNHGARPRRVNLGAGGRRGVDKKREEPQTPPRLSPKLPATGPPRRRLAMERKQADYGNLVRTRRLFSPPTLAFWARLIWPSGRTRGT